MASGSALALSAAMAGLVGSIFRRGGPLVAFRRRITYYQDERIAHAEGSVRVKIEVESTWRHLKPFAGAPEAIDRLRTQYTVVVHTILRWEGIVYGSKRARVQWDGILSCQFLGYYNPSTNSTSGDLR